MIDLLKEEFLRHEIDLDQIKELTEIQNKDGIMVYRFINQDQHLVIKFYEKEEYRREIKYYQLLKELEIPTIPVVSMTNVSIILEDMKYSNHYRLGVASDLENANLILGLVRWYKALHEKSALYLSEHPELVQDLFFEYDAITREEIIKLMDLTDSRHYPYWFTLLAHLDQILEKVNQLANTLTYNDFYWTNLIVSLDEKEVIMFDYNLLGRGFKFSDIRNVTSSLKGDARELFFRSYPYQEEEKMLDDVMSPLYGLMMAYKKDTMPSWGLEELEKVHNGVLEEAVIRLINHIN